MFSFTKRSGKIEVQRLLRRIIDASAFSHVPRSDEARGESRSNCMAAALVTPCEKGSLLLDRSVFGITKDWSSQGVAIVAPLAQVSETVVLGILVESEPHFLLGSVRKTTPIGGGFWQLGIELTELLTLDSSAGLRELLPLVAQLDARQFAS